MKDNLDIKKWAEEQSIELKKTILFHISEGIDKQTAIEMVLKDTTIGTGYKAQIRYELKYL